ncbi:MAG: zf-HC2 domain-containing protein [Acidobacteriia bacterium]|nr:zf-HC2 domain-containing protein [Terriglobia bacterium]
MHRFLDRELDREASLRVEAHLSACNSCRQEFYQLLDLEDQLESTPLPRISAGFAGRVIEQALRTREPAMTLPMRSFPTAVAACAIVIVTWVGFHIGEAYSTARRADIIQSALSSPIEPGS